MRAWAVLPLPYAIPTVAALSGKAIKGSIGGHPCQVAFPTRSGGMGLKSGRLDPPSASPRWRTFAIRWGGKIASVRGPAMSVSGLGLRFAFEDDVSESGQRTKDRIRFAAISWLPLMLDWLAVLHKQFPGSITVEMPLAFVEFDPDVTPLHMWDPSSFVSAETWRAAIRKASAGQAPPLAFVLMYRAIRAFHEADYRLAVVEAAAAVELAVSNLLQKTIEERNRSRALLAGAILGQIRMLGPKLELVRKLKLTGSSVELTAVSELRNSVLHRGQSPHRAEASKVIEAAAKFISQVDLT